MDRGGEPHQLAGFGSTSSLAGFRRQILCLMIRSLL